MCKGQELALSVLFPVGTVDVGKARLMFWDLGGQEELQSLWDKVRHITCLILFFSRWPLIVFSVRVPHLPQRFSNFFF